MLLRGAKDEDEREAMREDEGDGAGPRPPRDEGGPGGWPEKEARRGPPPSRRSRPKEARKGRHREAQQADGGAHTAAAEQAQQADRGARSSAAELVAAEEAELMEACEQIDKKGAE